MTRKTEVNKEAIDIVFLGGLFPKEYETEIINDSKGSIQNAANALQWNIVNGLDANLKRPIKIINALYVGSYPKRYKKANIPTFSFRHHNYLNTEDINVGFLNVCGVKILTRHLAIIPYIKKLCETDISNKKVLIAYALTSSNVVLLKYARKINKNITTCIIVPDLPQYMNLTNNKSLIYTLLKKIEIQVIKSNIKEIDHFVLLTKQMNDFIGAKSFCVVEGIAKESKIEKESNDSNIKMILYTGTLNRKYGVYNLVKAFSLIKDNSYKLVLCGSGDCEDEIITAAKIDNRIDFRGVVTREESLELQKQATVVINPRQNVEEFTKYSFPSKNMEYLASGTPLIAYKLDGIPDEYDQYIYYVEDESIEALRDKIIEVCEKSEMERFAFAKKARMFVLNNKNAIVQTKKILEMVNISN